MIYKVPPLAVIFDLDGVLIDSYAASVYSQNFIGKTYGFTLDEITSNSKRGGSLRDFYRALQKLRAFDTDFDTFADTMLEAYFSYLGQHTQGLDAALATFLEGLKKHGIPIAVGTSALKRSALRKLQLAGLDGTFEVIITADDVERHKPNPDIYIEAAKRLGVNPKYCVVIEDAAAGIEAAHAAGMKAIGFSKYVEDLRTLQKADWVVPDFSELDALKLKRFMLG